MEALHPFRTGWQPVAPAQLRPAPLSDVEFDALDLQFRQVSRYERIVKPAIDRVGALVLLVLLAPLMAAVALAVRIHLGRGILFRQVRVGHHGREFTMLKFRTMRPDRRGDRDGYDGPDRRVCHKREDDPRHTSLGRLLRKLSLDELPQLVNVLRGEVSLVGPRPELPGVVASYAPWQHARHLVRPGMTGLWQVTARASGGLMSERTEPDIDYVKRISFATDCSIMLRTIPVLLGRPSGS